jgi:hypothetical protein
LLLPGPMHRLQEGTERNRQDTSLLKRVVWFLVCFPRHLHASCYKLVTSPPLVSDFFILSRSLYEYFGLASKFLFISVSRLLVEVFLTFVAVTPTITFPSIVQLRITLHILLFIYQAEKKQFVHSLVAFAIQYAAEMDRRRSALGERLRKASERRQYPY